MKNELVKVDPREFGLEEVKATELTAGLDITLKERIPLIEEFNRVCELDVKTTNSNVFKSLRLLIRDNRTKGLEKWHKTSKAYFLAGCRFVDAKKNKEISINEQMESKLLEGEKYQERLEEERLIKLNEERVKEITPFLRPDAPQPIDLGYMPDDVWENYLLGAKASYDSRIAAEKKAEEERIAAEKKSEEERLERLAEQERIRKENEILKKEAERKEALRLAELKAIEEKENKAKLEREKLAKIEAEKQAKIKADLEAKAEAERQARIKSEKEAEQKRLKLENELKAKQEAEKLERERLAKIEAEKKEAERLASLAPEKEKIQKWIDSFSINNIDSSNMSESGKATINVITEKFNAFKKWAESQKETIK